MAQCTLKPDPPVPLEFAFLGIPHSGCCLILTLLSVFPSDFAVYSLWFLSVFFFCICYHCLFLSLLKLLCVPRVPPECYCARMGVLESHNLRAAMQWNTHTTSGPGKHRVALRLWHTTIPCGHTAPTSVRTHTQVHLVSCCIGWQILFQPFGLLSCFLPVPGILFIVVALAARSWATAPVILPSDHDIFLIQF